jgi:hypothetical protein
MHSLLLMTYHVSLRFTFLSTRVRSFIVLRPSRILLRRNNLFLSRNYTWIMGVSMSIMHSRIFVQNKAFNINNLFTTPLNKKTIMHSRIFVQNKAFNINNLFTTPLNKKTLLKERTKH